MTAVALARREANSPIADARSASYAPFVQRVVRFVRDSRTARAGWRSQDRGTTRCLRSVDCVRPGSEPRRPIRGASSPLTFRHRPASIRAQPPASSVRHRRPPPARSTCGAAALPSPIVWRPPQAPPDRVGGVRGTDHGNPQTGYAIAPSRRGDGARRAGGLPQLGPPRARPSTRSSPRTWRAASSPGTRAHGASTATNPRT